jgi:hypothetical protein
MYKEKNQNREHFFLKEILLITTNNTIKVDNRSTEERNEQQKVESYTKCK